MLSFFLGLVGRELSARYFSGPTAEFVTCIALLFRVYYLLSGPMESYKKDYVYVHELYCLMVPRLECQGSLEVTAITDTEILSVHPSFQSDFGWTAAKDQSYNKRKL